MLESALMKFIKLNLVKYCKVDNIYTYLQVTLQPFYNKIQKKTLVRKTCDDVYV